MIRDHIKYWEDNICIPNIGLDKPFEFTPVTNKRNQIMIQICTDGTQQRPSNLRSIIIDEYFIQKDLKALTIEYVNSPIDFKNQHLHPQE